METKDPFTALYKAEAEKASVLEIPELPFLSIAGEGSPEDSRFQNSVAALYTFSWTLKMSKKSGLQPAGFSDFKVAPLEGLWSIRPGESFFDPTRKDCLAWIMMIRQPQFVNLEIFENFRSLAKEKALKKRDLDSSFFDYLHFGLSEAGLFAQILHLGSYDDEPRSFEILEKQIEEQGFVRSSKDHREIYLNDPSRTKPEALKTLLRVALKRK